MPEQLQPQQAQFHASIHTPCPTHRAGQEQVLEEELHRASPRQDDLGPLQHAALQPPPGGRHLDTLGAQPAATLGTPTLGGTPPPAARRLDDFGGQAHRDSQFWGLGASHVSPAIPTSSVPSTPRQSPFTALAHASLAQQSLPPELYSHFGIHAPGMGQNDVGTHVDHASHGVERAQRPNLGHIAGMGMDQHGRQRSTPQ